METLKFPEAFLWGTATSAYQVEGGIEKCDWSEEFPAGRACNHYNLYEKDFDLLKSLNQNAYRFSIEWSRIEPEEGKFDEREIEHYRKVLLALKKKNFKVMLTLHHFTSPLWLAEIGGWENPEVVFYFLRFAKRIFTEYFDFVDFWITINEPLVFASESYLDGTWPPKKKSFFSLLNVIKNQIATHKKIFEEFHKIKKDVKVGIAKNNAHFESFNPKSYLDKFNVRINRYFWNEFFLNRVKNYLDFIGLNYYFHQKIKFPSQNKNENKVLSDMSWEIHPEGIYHVLKELKKYKKSRHASLRSANTSPQTPSVSGTRPARCFPTQGNTQFPRPPSEFGTSQIPIYITENGLADAKDKLRKDFIKNHLYWIHRAISEGIDVRGYFHWSLIDNFEWAKGFEPRFGLVEIDYKTLERKPRPSAFYYAEICKENQLILNSRF
jgi:beta-glucosidase